jgi:hypothetical protein
MTDLSPAAQVVLDAANGAQSYGPDDCLNESRWIAAATLRAAVAHTQQHHNHDVWKCDADELLAIATELEQFHNNK